MFAGFAYLFGASIFCMAVVGWIPWRVMPSRGVVIEIEKNGRATVPANGATGWVKRKLLKRTRFLLAILDAFAIHFFFFRAPSEAAMLEKFQQRKADFEQLRLMLEQDKNVETIGSDWVRTKWGGRDELPLNISASRIALYRSRLKDLGFARVDSYKGRVQLEQFGGGFTDTTWGIGYVWSARPLTPLVRSAYHSMPMRDHWNFSRIEGNWYIYHRR